MHIKQMSIFIIVSHAIGAEKNLNKQQSIILNFMKILLRMVKKEKFVNIAHLTQMSKRMTNVYSLVWLWYGQPCQVC